MKVSAFREPHQRPTEPTLAGDHLKLARTVFENEALQVFQATAAEPMTASELSLRCGIPISRCRRLLHKLERLGLLSSQDGCPGRNGVRPRLYRSALRSIRVYVEERGVRTRVEVEGTAIPLIAECMTTIESPADVEAPPTASHRRGHAGAGLVHFIDPPEGDASLRKVPINLPAFLQPPLPRRPGRR